MSKELDEYRAAIDAVLASVENDGTEVLSPDQAEDAIPLMCIGVLLQLGVKPYMLKSQYGLQVCQDLVSVVTRVVEALQ